MNFFGSKMAINEPKMFINFFWRYAMGKMSINKPLSGLGWRMKNSHETSHENLNRMYYLLLITYYLKKNHIFTP